MCPLSAVMVCCCGLGSGHGRVMMLRASHYLNASNTSITVTLDSSAFGKLDFSVPGYGKFSNVTTVQVPPGCEYLIHVCTCARQMIIMVG